MAKRLPLWQVMQKAAALAPEGVPTISAELRALRDWLVPEETIEDAPGRFVNGCCLEQRQRLRALLTAEADRAERGDVA